MNCLCYQVVLKECLSQIVLSTGFLPLTPHHVFITDKFSNRYHLPVTSNAEGELTLNLSLLPAGHFMAFSGSYQLQVYTAITTGTGGCPATPTGTALTLTICGTEYTCIDVTFTANTDNATTQTIPDCDSLQPQTTGEQFCVPEHTSNFCPTVKACLGISSTGTGIRFLNDLGEFIEVQPGATTLGALTNVNNNADTTADGNYTFSITGGIFSLQPFAVDQATEATPGIAALATQAQAQNELTTTATTIITPVTLWLALQRFTQLAITWAARQIFTTAPRFNSTGASHYLKTDASKDLTSVAAIPATDITQDTNHRFVTDLEKTGWNNTNSIGSKLYLFHNY